MPKTKQVDTRIEATFGKTRETKNAVRFEEETDNSERGVIGNIYVLKVNWEKMGSPERIAVFVEPLDA